MGTLSGTTGGEKKEKRTPSPRAKGICVFFVLLCHPEHDSVSNGACSVGWLQDPQAASSLSKPWCKAGGTLSAATSHGAGLVSGFGSCAGWFVVALPQLWELSFSGLEIASRLRSLQCLTSLSCSGLSSLILHPSYEVTVTKPSLTIDGTFSREGTKQHHRRQQCKERGKKMQSQHRREQNNIKLGEGQWLERRESQMRAQGCKVVEIYLLFPELRFFPS